MRIALITAADPFEESGGAERTLTKWLSYLSEEGYEVDVLTYGDEDVERRSGCSVTRLDDKCPVSSIDRFCRTNPLDAVMTMAGWGDISLWATDRHGIPSIVCVMSDFDLNLATGLASDVQPTRAIAVSNDYRERASDVYDCEVRTVYQPIDFEYYTVSEMTRETYTLINPITYKGGELFKQLAQHRNGDRFLAKMGWFHQRNDDLTFDRDTYDIYSRTVSEFVPTPVQPDFTSVPNVEFVREGDIRDIYRRTKVLLVPSQWDESFGRVVIEAMHNGIPVVASKVGGLPEACGDAAILVEEYDSIDSWDECLDQLADQELYEEYVAKGKTRAKRYSEQQSEELIAFESIVREVIEDHSAT